MPDGPPRPVQVELRRIRLPLLTPHVAAHGCEAVRDVVLVAVELEDGAAGWGECAALGRPTYTAEYTAGAWAVLCAELVPAALADRASGVVGHPMAKAALGDALLDADLRRRGVGLAAALGATGGAVPTTTVIAAAAAVAETVARVAAAGGGFKLKIRPGWDVEPLRAVRSTWPDRWLAADANGSYDAADDGDQQRLLAIDQLGLAYLEQPTSTLLEAVALRRSLTTPICLDEPVESLDAARIAIALAAATVLNVKPGRVGGVREAAAVVAGAAEAGLDAFVGGMLETGVGRATAAVVAALPGCTLPTDLGPSHRYFRPDLTAPVEVDGAGHLVVPPGPGIGVTPDPDRLDAATVERVVCTP